jgi:hypothetical protein
MYKTQLPCSATSQMPNPQLKDQGSDSVLPDQGYYMHQGMVTYVSGAMAE